MLESAAAPPPIPESAGVLSMAGFWRRAGALLLDVIVLGAFGFCLGVVFYDPLAAVGPSAQFIGFVIAVAYYGIQNSRLFGGQTLGKRALGIRVVGRDGSTISVGRAVVRALLICVMIVNIQLFDVVASGLVGKIYAIALGLWALALAYFVIFNRANRRTVHDFATGTSVVRKGPGTVRLQPTSRSLIVGMVILVVVGGAGLIVLNMLLRNGAIAGIDLGQLQRVQSAIEEDPRIHTASVTYMYTWTNTDGGKSSTYGAEVWLKDPKSDYAKEAQDVARVLLRSLAENPDGLRAPDRLGVTITVGYDLGIASSFTRHPFVKTVAEWSRDVGPEDGNY